ncbi:MAG: DNA-directed RNA polymerase subunit alpha [Dehalococcoidales bacterium]|nr:DNA-directed RNA polymerase subunit alpha [Dehalococcoidales bacterium]
MSHLVVPNIECVESRDNFGRFAVEPLEKGVGVTLGNAMRRVLFVHLHGAAVTRVKIEGIQHEFSTIPHVKEDTMEFLLNVKALRLKSVTGQPGKLTLEVDGERRVTAADIKPSAEFEIANPELYLVSLDSPEARLYVEFDVEMSEGYKEAESSDNMPVGVIPVDAIFTPMRKVNFTVEPIHIGEETSLERLYLEVWTDGTITPAEAVSRTAEILIEQLTPFTGLTKVPELEGEAEAALPAIAPELANMPVEQLNLSVRTQNCLRRGSINTVGEVVSKTEKELMSLRNFGLKSKQELEDRLKSLGLSLAE